MANDDFIIRKAKVISVDDKYDAMRIKVRLGGSDGTKTDVELPDVFPLLPKLLHVTPKVGECVLVILEKMGSPNEQRYFIGPVLSQPYQYNKELYDISAMNALVDAKAPLLQHPEMDCANDGSLPDYDDVAIIGRENTDIVLKPEELRLRCGYKETPTGPVEERLQFNYTDPAYIQMRYKTLRDKNYKEFKSVINVVADRINLLSRDSKDVFNLTDQKDLITDDELVKILDEAHPLPYGDELVSFLKKFLDVFRRHTHPYSMVVPSFSGADMDLFNQNLNTMLSNAVRIN